MSETPDEIGGDLPPLDADLASWLSADAAGPMPADVWAQIEGRLAAEPPMVPAGVVDLDAERTRRRPRRALPFLVGAAGLAIAGAVVLPSLQTSSPTPVVAEGAQTQEPDTVQSDASSGLVVSAPAPAPSPTQRPQAAMPRAMVATGVDYTAETTPDQVATLLTSAGMTDAAAISDAVAASPSPEAMPAAGFASSPEALAACLERLGLSPSTIPLVLDTATIDGQAGYVVVTWDPQDESAQGPSPDSAQPASVHVVGVGQECTEADAESALHWDIPVG